MCAPTREEFLATSITPATPSPSDTECTICTEDYTTTSHTPVTFSDTESCKHIFCEVCIVAWLNAAGTNTCPLCRRELFVLAPEDREVDYEMNMNFDTDEEDDDEEEEEEEDIPLTYLYRNELRFLLSPTEVEAVLTSIWHKTWNLLSTYRFHIAQTLRQRRQTQETIRHLNFPLFDRYLPTTNTLLDSFFNTVAASARIDIDDLLSMKKIAELDTLLKIVLHVQKELVQKEAREHGDTYEDEGCVPPFSGTTRGGDVFLVQGYEWVLRDYVVSVGSVFFRLRR